MAGVPITSGETDKVKLIKTAITFGNSNCNCIAAYYRSFYL